MDQVEFKPVQKRIEGNTFVLVVDQAKFIKSKKG